MFQKIPESGVEIAFKHVVEFLTKNEFDYQYANFMGHKKEFHGDLGKHRKHRKNEANKSFGRLEPFFDETTGTIAFWA